MDADKIHAAFATLGELAVALLEGGASEAEAEAPPKASKKATRKKKATKKKAPAKSDGPPIDEVRAACLELVETVDEDEDGEEDGNEVLLSIISGVDEEATRLGDLEGQGSKLQAVMDAAKKYLAENYEDEG